MKFVGVRIMHVDLTGAMTKKCVMVQPAVVTDGAAIGGGDGATSENVHHPPILVR